MHHHHHNNNNNNSNNSNNNNNIQQLRDFFIHNGAPALVCACACVRACVNCSTAITHPPAAFCYASTSVSASCCASSPPARGRWSCPTAQQSAPAATRSAQP